MWMLYPIKVALVVNVVLMFFLLLFLKNGFEIFTQLYVKEDEAVSGQFSDFANVYSHLGELDRRQGDFTI